MKKKNTITFALIFVLILSIGTAYYIKQNKTEKLKENNNIKNTNQLDKNINLDNGDEKIDWSLLDSSILNLNNKSVTITKEGTYTLSGKINNGNITVNTTGDVKLILDSVSIKSNNSPAIIIEQANNTVIELKENTINTLKDSTTYDNTEYDGCLFSRDDLIIQGTGTLNITSNYLDGIVSNDDLKIIDGTYIINSNDDGIRGKDSINIQNGNFTINSQSDAIKSTNDAESGKGYINIDNGTFTIESKQDALQAETKLIINNGIFDIKTGDGSSSKTSAIHKDFYNGTSYDTTSTKALKSNDNLIINNGTITIDSQDDAIHSNNYVGIKNGTINITSGDNGIHADTEIIIDGGNINIKKSYEGIESNDITINDGEISITSNDDGINISGGNDSSSMGGRPGENPMYSSSFGILTINNGKIYVNADGDGLDANGSIIINNGELYVDGPTNGGNGTLDYDRSFNINGGTVIAVGSSDMAQSPSTSSTQNSLMFYLSTSYNNKEIILEDENGNEIISYTPKKIYSSIIISSKKICEGKTYTLKIDNKKITSLTSSSIITTDGQSNGPSGNHHPGGPGPRR